MSQKLWFHIPEVLFVVKVPVQSLAPWLYRLLLCTTSFPLWGSSTRSMEINVEFEEFITIALYPSKVKVLFCYGQSVEWAGQPDSIRINSLDSLAVAKFDSLLRDYCRGIAECPNFSSPTDKRNEDLSLLHWSRTLFHSNCLRRPHKNNQRMYLELFLNTLTRTSIIHTRCIILGFSKTPPERGIALPISCL